MKITNKTLSEAAGAIREIGANAFKNFDTNLKIGANVAALAVPMAAYAKSHRSVALKHAIKNAEGRVLEFPPGSGEIRYVNAEDAQAEFDSLLDETFDADLSPILTSELKDSEQPLKGNVIAPLLGWFIMKDAPQ